MKRRGEVAGVSGIACGRYNHCFMRFKRILRLTLFSLPVIASIALAYNAITSPPDPGYGRSPSIMMHALLGLVMWTPYHVVCMFLDGDRVMGIIVMTIAGLALANLAWASASGQFGYHIIALLLCSVALIAVWIVAVISFFTKDRADAQKK